MTIKERLKEYIKYTKISERQFCKIIGVSSSYVNNINKSIQPDKIDSIAKHFPLLNTGWLLTGEGKMLKQQDDNTEIASISNYISIPIEVWTVIKNQSESLKEKDQHISELISLLKNEITEFKKTCALKDDTARNVCAG
mgnify:FL=1|nr:helix-turn-helix transcriptional regulator [uncultured Butyricimonas sp.]